ncbi:hypothetical protein NCU04808 [Neurospora crassa OR74A]|uniref:Uncharacterized protein n=1 Tax=Neurospora crassa (strain ATCC 24698 / 74-OR23-1A / CBS 708.71 / DSM 1257 / FGSC 987) TaxID=367110 RepID=V5IN18_NEUCR|nr:hypothetical protein NCU04808 [Neurospora crassa OR74A]ESA42151.1 hypothetical protein NCU04808 [Neurospora crassa OR74A]|eukprot:XP_011394923.1 hypothetical protein NCU04808 [Neurospora crassa OR74A]
MQSLFTVNSNISLISLTIAPSAWVATLVVFLFFLYFYLPQLVSLKALFFRFNFLDKANKHAGAYSTAPRDPRYREGIEDINRRNWNRNHYLRQYRGADYDNDDYYQQYQYQHQDYPHDDGGAQRIEGKELHYRQHQQKAIADKPLPALLEFFGRKKSNDSNISSGGTSPADSPRKLTKERDKEKSRGLSSFGRKIIYRTSRDSSPSQVPSSARHVISYGPRQIFASHDSCNGGPAEEPRASRPSSRRFTGGLRALSLAPGETPHPQHPHHHQQATPFGYPSVHSGFRSDDTESDMSDQEVDGGEASHGGYSPPAWRRLANGDRSSGFWRKANSRLNAIDPLLLSGFGGLGGGLGNGGWSREFETSPEYDSMNEDDMDQDAILQKAIRTRLPTGSLSPEKERSPEPEYARRQQLQKQAERQQQHQRLAPVIEEDDVKIKEEPMEEDAGMVLRGLPRKGPDNYFRFAVRAEVHQRTEPIETAVTFLRKWLGPLTTSWSSMFLSGLVAILSYAAMRSLFQPASMSPVPDLVKVAGVARSFEPLIYYSENGIQQVGDLQATGVAVWDLGESVRSSNLTSAPIIVKELDELSESLKTLAIELTKFFANVDGDIDGILIVMDWARRELSQLQHLPSPPLSSFFDNVHNLLSAFGILEDPSTSQPTRLGLIATSLFGPSTPQRTRTTLQRTFNEFLAVLEEAITNELQHSLAIFALFEAIDHQFLNLARTVVRESSLQEELHADLLSSLWTRILGAKASDIQKYERNRLLLLNVREKTVRNKGILVEHNHKLLALKASLENLRRKLVSPLVRSVNSSTLTIDEQIRGLEDVGVYLEGVRTRQKGKLMEMLYGGGSYRAGIGSDGGGGGQGSSGGGGYGGGQQYGEQHREVRLVADAGGHGYGYGSASGATRSVHESHRGEQ